MKAHGCGSLRSPRMKRSALGIVTTSGVRDKSRSSLDFLGFLAIRQGIGASAKCRGYRGKVVSGNRGVQTSTRVGRRQRLLTILASWRGRTTAGGCSQPVIGSRVPVGTPGRHADCPSRVRVRLAGTRVLVAAVRGVLAQGAAGPREGRAAFRPLGAAVPVSTGEQTSRWRTRCAGSARDLERRGRCQDWQVRQAEQALRIYFINFLNRPEWQRQPASGVVDDQGHVNRLAALQQLRARVKTRHYSYRTEGSYADWVRRFLDYLARAAGGRTSSRGFGIGTRLPDPSGRRARASPRARRTRRSAPCCSCVAKCSGSTSRASHVRCGPSAASIFPSCSACPRPQRCWQPCEEPHA